MHLLHGVAQVQSEIYTYARWVGGLCDRRQVTGRAGQQRCAVSSVCCRGPFLHPQTALGRRQELPALLPPTIEHLAGQLASLLARLDAGCPVEALLQYYLDLAWLDAVLSRWECIDGD